MAYILNVKDNNGNWITLPALQGPQGPKGEKGDKGATGATGPAVAVVDNLTSTSTTTALSANQGKVLNTSLTNLNTTVTNLTTTVNGKAATSHASTATTYGIGTTTAYGHCMTINALTTSSHANGKALSAYQGYVLNNSITNNTYYKSGDTYTLTGDWTLAGYTSSSRQAIVFTFFTPKSIEKISTITVNTLSINVRHADGGYMGTSAYVAGGYNFLSIGSAEAKKTGPNCVTIYFTLNSAHSYANNTPVSVSQGTIKVTFS